MSACRNTQMGIKMSNTMILMIPIVLPILCGIFLLVMKEPASRKVLTGYVTAVLLLTGAAVLYAVSRPVEAFTLFNLTQSLPVYFKLDEVGRLFVSIVTIVWILAGIFSFEYMKHEECNKRYYGFYLIVYGVLAGLDFAGNLITFYIFYELMTLCSMPLVLHNRSREAIMAGLKYLFYSFCGAYMVLFGIYFLYRYSNTLSFTAGGVLDRTLAEGQEGMLLLVCFLMIVGFGVKAGMFPLHAWLPTAHPVAPAPASAALSGIIVKSGVLGVIRVVFYMFGADFIRGTWVQTTWLILTLITVFMGSMLAYREKLLKKRLAYSTVSQVSYILFGLALLHPVGMTGALLHVVFHAFIKCTLFLCAGAVIYQTGRIRVDELRGIGKEMPVTMWCYTFASLALIGIPPASGFISKWYLATGALQAQVGLFGWLGPVVLLVSALLTAGYLLPLTMRGFFPGADKEGMSWQKREPVKMMLIPLILLTALAVLPGLFPNVLIDFVAEIASNVM